MRGGKIFLVGQTTGDLTTMQEEPYGQEIVIQELLAKYPDLLAGDQMTPDDPRRWLLITREMPVPDETQGAGRWSLDHLFVDQDGVPTFVECKRAADPRSRREVVAQMLDYAANGIAYWPIADVVDAATATAGQRGTTLDLEIQRLLGIEFTIDLDGGSASAEVVGFWRQVEVNLKQGRVRLIFVAEETSHELRRLVEFLNEKLEGVEVLAVEVKQYLGRDQQVLVPRLVGMTEAARVKNDVSQRRRRRITRPEFLARCSDAARALFEDILDRSERHGHNIYLGETGLSIRGVSTNGRLFTYAYCWAPGQYDVYLKDWPATPQQMQAVRSKLLSSRLFSEGGSYTLRAPISVETADGVRQAHNAILDDIMRFVSEPDLPADQSD